MNKNLKNIEISGIRKFFNEVSKVEGAISLTLGEPDFNTPNIIKNAMVKAIEENKTTYTQNAGLDELRQEISNYLTKLNIHYKKDEICITVGGSEALFSVFLSLLNTGDSVLIPTPAYPAYENIIKLLGGKVIHYKLDKFFEIDIDDLEKKIQKNKSKYLVLSFPCNPTGAILSQNKYIELINLIKKYNLLVITDDIYSSLSYDEYYSVAQCSEIIENIIYINGFSKMFSFTGLRVGYVCAKERYLSQIIKTHQYNVSCATSIAQWGALAGLKHALKDVEYMKSEFKKRRDYIYDRLIKMGIEVIKPKGAFYIFASIKKYNMSSEEFCKLLLNKYKVAIVPGSAFGVGGEGYIRISYCYSMEDLTLALDKLQEMIASLES